MAAPVLAEFWPAELLLLLNGHNCGIKNHSGQAIAKAYHSKKGYFEMAYPEAERFALEVWSARSVGQDRHRSDQSAKMPEAA